jgi:hypothetical protein
MTGIVKLSLNTRSVSMFPAILIVCAYTVVLCFAAYMLETRA